MKQAAGGTDFIIIGENIHCSRVVKREGVRGGVDPDGRPGLHFPDGDGGEAWLPLPDSIVESKEFTSSERIKHVIDGQTVLQYTQPQLDDSKPEARKLIQDGDKLLRNGTISLQAESHPVEFRKVELRKLGD